MISKRIVAIGIFLAMAGLAAADNDHLATLKVGTEVYTNVTITSVSPTEIFFSHSRGIGNAKLKNLQPELQKKFHFDPAKSNLQQQNQAKANALYNQAVRSSPPPGRPAAPVAEPEAHPPDPANGIPRPPIRAKSFLNQRAPGLEVEKWLTEAPDTGGKCVLLDFWATWCGPCRKSIPDLNKLQARFRDQLVVIGVSDEPEMQVRRMTTPKMDYAVAIDTAHRTKSAVEVQAIPHSIFIDPSGIVRFEGHPGYLNEQNLELLLSKYGK